MTTIDPVQLLRERLEIAEAGLAAAKNELDARAEHACSRCWAHIERAEKAEEELVATKALLARVFEDQCRSDWILVEGKKVWREGCMLRDSERGYCDMTDYVDAAELGRLPACPYLPFEEVKK